MKKKAIPVPPAGRCLHISEWCAHTAVRAPEHKEERSESETPPAGSCAVYTSLSGLCTPHSLPFESSESASELLE